MAYVIERHTMVGNTENIAWMDDHGEYDGLALARIFDTYEDAENCAGPLDVIKSWPYIVCPICGEEWSKDDMQLTYDCHGIPFRFVCPDCYDKAMEKGYDGEYYTELDECIDDYY